MKSAEPGNQREHLSRSLVISKNNNMLTTFIVDRITTRQQDKTSVYFNMAAKKLD